MSRASAAADRCASRALLHCAATALLVALLAGCEPARSSESDPPMIFGLFKGKQASVVNPAVGASLVREAAFPHPGAPPQPAWAALRNVSVDGPPPAGVLAPDRAEHPPAEAFILPAAGARPPLAVVNTYDDKRRCTIWELDARGTRFAKERPVQFDPKQPAWIMYSAATVLPVSADQLLIHLRAHRPQVADMLFVYDAAADRVRALGDIEPDWSQGVPFKFIESLPVSPDTLLVLFHTGKERLGPQRYVNHQDHVVLFSPRHREGLEILTLALDDGAVRQWGMTGAKLWLATSDDRGSAPKTFTWSLDLQRVL